jgi:hypothetical protein
LCYWLLAAFAITLAIGFVLGDSMSLAGKRVAKVAGVDPPGYFDVSHAILFHRNFDITDEYHHVKPDDSPFTALRKETGHYGTVYAIGYSILAAPFLGAGTLVDRLAGNAPDGYSHFAILGYCLTNVVLTGLGLIALFTFLRNVAESWGTAPRPAALYALFAVGATFCGTNVGFYAFSPMSHASTVFCACVFLAYWWRVRDRTDIPSWILLGLIGGLLSISRWQDIFFLGGPILADLFSGTAGIVSRIRSRVAYGIVAVLWWIPQLLEWKYMYGKYLTVPQGDGFFVFPPVFVPQALFSTRDGWFMWTPLVLLGLTGLVWGSLRAARLILPWLVVVTLEIAIVGSMWTWHGGEGFSERYLTSSAPLIALGLVTLLCLATRNVRVLAMAAAVVCCVFTVVGAVQFRLDLVPRSDRLTASEYLTDKFRLREVRRRKAAVQRAEQLIGQGSPAAAVAALEEVEVYGPDREVFAELSKAYRASGREAEAQDTDRRLTMFLQSRLF